MKLIATDNYNRETVSDTLVAENVPEHWAEIIKTTLNDRIGGNTWIEVVADDYKLFKYEP